jgi:fumarate reductase subunit C
VEILIFFSIFLKKEKIKIFVLFFLFVFEFIGGIFCLMKKKKKKEGYFSLLADPGDIKKKKIETTQTSFHVSRKRWGGGINTSFHVSK